MKLSVAEKASLYELTISTGRPDNETQRLVELGLVETGKGKFGNYVRITAKGKALANTFTREEQIAFLSKDLDMTSGRGARATSGVLAAAKGECSLSRSKPPRRRSAIPPASTTPADSAAECRETSNVGGTANPTPSHIPNAVRVVRGAKASYYPISTPHAGFLDGKVERVFTANKPYRSYAVGASTADDLVF